MTSFCELDLDQTKIKIEVDLGSPDSNSDSDQYETEDEDETDNEDRVDWSVIIGDELRKNLEAASLHTAEMSIKRIYKKSDQGDLGSSSQIEMISKAASLINEILRDLEKQLKV